MRFISRDELETGDLPLMIRLAERMPTATENYDASQPPTDVRWQTWTDNGQDVHIDHHFD